MISAPCSLETYKVQLTVGGDKLDYEEYARSPVVSLFDTKILLDSVISDANKGARYCTADIKNFYLNNPVKTYRYIKTPIHLFIDEILEEYNISNIIQKLYVYV